MKKIFYLLICLALIASLLALASCTGGDDSDKSDKGDVESSDSSKTDGDGEDNTPGASSVPSGSTTDSSNNQGGTDDSVNQGGTDSSVNQGGADSSTNQSGGADENPDDGNKEKITVKFTCVAGTLVSGSKEVKIDKGSSLLLNQMPVFERKGYVIMWSYDIVGEKPWICGDTFDKDTTLFATWKNENSFDALRALVSKIQNFRMDTEISIKSNGLSFTQSTVTLIDGGNAYSEITADGVSEMMWYVDGMFYTVYGDQKVKMPLSQEQYENYFGGAVITESTVFGIDSAHVSSVTKDSNKYTVVVDCEKYSQSIKGTTPVELVYTKMVFTFEFDDSGLLTKLTTDANLTADGVPQENLSVSEFSNIGTTGVNAPENADEFVLQG